MLLKIINNLLSICKINKASLKHIFKEVYYIEELVKYQIPSKIFQKHVKLRKMMLKLTII